MPADHPEPSFRPLALLAAAVFPGLGHFITGQRARGACIAAGILGLFVSGLLVGGIDTIDSKEDRVWFYGQALVGPLAFGVDYVHQNHLKVKQGGVWRSANPTEGRGPDGSVVAGGTPPASKSVGKMNEIGTLSTIAGMLNLIVILDAAFPGRRQPHPAQAGAGVGAKGVGA
jgi:hypothetical protein